MGYQMKDFVAVPDGEKQITCPVCGKMFTPAEEHSYYIEHNKRKLVCTYTCMRKWEKGEVERLFAPKPKNRKYGDIRIVETGETFQKHSGVCCAYKSSILRGVKSLAERIHMPWLPH